ncbi:unnamed protein product [Adineta steineri]|uniref:Methyltransferase domain-containing protein n=1 Tax=Adineta steineri TaxID=433720 RepID=A0A818WNV9_9BILA|nr:unnamed protein product [Adineta steineri]CAF3728113.1 unnamed protein product [Adineta steineri]
MGLMQYNRYRFLVTGVIICFIIILYYNRQTIPHKYDMKQNESLCYTAMIESDQLLCESDEKWQKRRKFYLQQHEKNIFTMNEYKNYFYKNWFPDFQCEHEMRVGEGDGGKWACDIEYLKKKPSCLIYSLGSQGDFTFEQSAHKLLPQCSIHTVDMQLYTCPTGICTFHQAKLGNGRNGSTSLHQLMTKLNQTNHEIDILKIDIEYGEYAFLHTLFSNNDDTKQLQPVYIRQILIEIHLDRDKIYETNSLFYLLNSQNYVIYHKELNQGFPYYACEYGLLKLNRLFFRGHLT